MAALTVLRELEAAGVVVRVEAGQLVAGPASAIAPGIRDTIRQHKSELIDLLRDPPDLRALAPTSLRLGTMVCCDGCRHCDPRPGERPDAWCRRHGAETWARVPFACGDWCPGGREEKSR